jgi:hypothetical protein
MAKKIGHGSQLWVDEASDTTYTQLSNVVKITPPPAARDDVDMTTLESTLQEFDPSDPPNWGELSFEIMWHPSQANSDIPDTLFAAKTAVNWKIVFPFSTAVNKVFSGWVKSLTPADLSSKDPIKRTIVVRLTSAITTS